MHEYDLAFVIPCYNEEKRLQKTLDDIDVFTWPNRTMVIFVDDGSTDATLSMLQQYAAKQHVFDIRVISQKTNQGKGEAIRNAFASVQASYYGFTDADLAFGLNPLSFFLEALTTHDIAIASRASTSKGFYDQFRKRISGIFSWIGRVLTQVNVKDTQAGFKCFTADAVQQVLPLTQQKRFAFDIECLAHAEQQKLRIAEISLAFTHEKHSSITFSDGMRYLFDLLAVLDGLPYSTKTVTRQAFFLAFGLSFVLYGWIIGYGYFYSDDFTWLWFGKRILENPANILLLKSGTFFSPIMNLYYTIMMALFGPSASAFLAMNIAIHAIFSVAVSRFILLLTRSRLTSMLGLLLTVVAGGAYEPVVWVGSNMHSIASLAIIAAYYAGVRYFETTNVQYFLASSIAQLIAYSTKEISIVLFPMITVLWLYTWFRAKSRKAYDWVLVAISGALFAGYLAYQFILQDGGQTFATNRYELNARGLARLPFAIADLFVPIQAMLPSITHSIALLLVLAIGLTGCSLFFIYRKKPLVYVAYAWMISAALPTLFFETPTWWYPLASRYTYLPKIGAVMLIALLLSHFIVSNSRRVIHLFALVLAGISIWQFWFMVNILTTEYAYIYRTGRTLVAASEQLRTENIEHIIVHHEHPFRGNDAHILGALDVYGGIPESLVGFYRKNEAFIYEPGMTLFYWNAETREYAFTTDQEMIQRLIKE